MTSYYFDPIAALWLLAGLILGLLIGRVTWGHAARRRARAAENVGAAATAAAARTQIEHNARELEAVQASVRPLADEVDRLKRELAKAKRPFEPPLPGAVTVRPSGAAAVPVPLDARPEPRSSAAVPVMPLVEAIAGTGPIVVGDAGGGAGSMNDSAGAGASAGAAGAVPGLRQLKGVGNNLAAALEGIGLTSVDSIARLTGDEAIDADGRLGVFNGRIAKDRLVEQAVLLDEGRMTEYETRFGRIGGPVPV